MAKDSVVYIKHILDCIYMIESFVVGLDKDDFLSDDNAVVRSAVVRELEVIGEAANQTEQDFRSRYPDIPWRDMIDTRNKIIHDYMSVDYELVWDIIVKDLPSLRLQLEALLKSA